jgi:TonB family protein
MKKLIFTLLLFGFVTNLFSEIAVKSFRKLENDLDARVNEPLRDQNGDVCAIIKVVTTQTGFSSFDCGQIGVVKTVQKPSEIWVYVPYGAKRITITHPQLGMIRDYFFTVPVEKATVYEMVLITGRIETTVVDEMNSQWLVITPDPADAMIYLDENFVKSGVYQAKVKPGMHSYRVELALYHSEIGKIEITDTKKVVNVKLKPAFGFFSVNTEPESGAKVIVDGKTQAKTTPYLSEALESGEYTVQVVKEMYQPITKKVMVYDGQTSPVNFVLPPNFSEITVTAPAEATIYINNQQKGIGTWQGRLSAGVYTFEARRDKHRPAKQDVNILAGDNKTIDLQPTAIFGTLDVISEPPGANIIIDDKDYGTTPNTIYKLPIGDYKVQLSKTGYSVVNSLVTITDGKSSELFQTLTVATSSSEQAAQLTTGSLDILTMPSGATIKIDGNNYGTTPNTITGLTIGNHILQLEKGGYMAANKTFIINGGKTTQISETLNVGSTVTNQQPTAPISTAALTGSLIITSKPSGASIKIDDKDYGVTPKTVNDLAIGEHIVQLDKTGYYSSQKAINIRAGLTSEFTETLSNGADQNVTSSTIDQRTVTIDSSPAGADLSIDGNPVGQTPYIVIMPVGTHQISLKIGKTKFEKQIQVTPTGGSKYLFQLKTENTVAPAPTTLANATIDSDQTIYEAVETMPSFPGGSLELFKFLKNNIKYPNYAQENSLQGRVICQFVVAKDGSISDIVVVKSIHTTLDNEAIRVIKSMPKWTPGIQKGKIVRTKYTLPVAFKLTE